MAKKIFSLNSDNMPSWLNNVPAIMAEDGDLKLIPENNEMISVKTIVHNLKSVSKRIIANNFNGVLT